MLGRAEYRVFGALVIAEIGLAVVLVIGAGLLLRSYINLTSTDPGFDSSRILSVRLNATHLPIDIRANRRDDGTMEFSGTGYQRIIDFYNELMTRVRGIAGVVNVAGAQELPLYLNPTQASPEPFTIVGRPGPNGWYVFVLSLPVSLTRSARESYRAAAWSPRTARGRRE